MVLDCSPIGVPRPCTFSYPSARRCSAVLVGELLVCRAVVSEQGNLDKTPSCRREVRKVPGGAPHRGLSCGADIGTGDSPGVRMDGNIEQFCPRRVQGSRSTFADTSNHEEAASLDGITRPSLQLDGQEFHPSRSLTFPPRKAQQCTDAAHAATNILPDIIS